MEDKEFMETLKALEKFAQNPCDKTCEKVNLTDEQLNDFAETTLKNIAGGKTIPKEDLMALMPIFDVVVGDKRSLQTDFIKATIEEKNAKTRTSSQKQFLSYFQTALLANGASAEDIDGVDFCFGKIKTKERPKHKSLVTKYDKFPKQVKEVYLTADDDLARLDVVKKYQNMSKEDYELIKKDITLARDIDVCVATIKSHVEDKHIESLVAKLTLLIESVDAMALYTANYDRLFKHLLVTSEDSKQICGELDHFVEEVEKESETTFEKNNNTVFKLKREVEKAINDAFAFDKKDHECMVKAQKIEKEIFAHRRDEKTQEVFKKYDEPLSESDFESCDWDAISTTLTAQNELLKSCKQGFDLADKNYRKAKRDYENLCQKMKVFFDPKTNHSGVNPKSIQTFGR